MKRKVLIVIGIIYVLLTIMVTKFLLDKNKFGVYETKNNYFICSELIKEYPKTSLVRFSKNVDYTSLINDKVYYFDESKELKYDVLKSIEDDGMVFTINETKYNIDNLLGKANASYILLGGLLNFLTTKVFYLVFIIIPMTLLLIYEIYLFVAYIRNGKVGKDSNNAKIVDKRT